MQSRVRALPSRVVVYLLLAGCLFEGVGYRQVWHRLVTGLPGPAVSTPTAGALCQARRRVGAAPLRFLFDLLRGPAATSATAGVRWCGLLVCAVDGTTMSVPDSPANLVEVTRQRGHHGGSGYPLIRLLALVACGTRTVIDAVFGPTSGGEITYAYRLTRSMRPGMIVLADRNFAAGKLITAITRTGAPVLVRCKSAGSTGPKLPVLRRLPDGSYLSVLAGVSVRVIDAEITIATTAGRHTGVYRLATTLVDPHRYPAFERVKLYHQRWEIETAYLEIKSTISADGCCAPAPRPASPRRSTPCWSPTGPAPGHDRGHQHPTRHRPRPGQLHHRPARRPRSTRPSREHHRRGRHRSRRRHRPPGPG